MGPYDSDDEAEELEYLHLRVNESPGYDEEDYDEEDYDEDPYADIP